MPKTQKSSEPSTGSRNSRSMADNCFDSIPVLICCIIFALRVSQNLLFSYDMIWIYFQDTPDHQIDCVPVIRAQLPTTVRHLPDSQTSALNQEDEDEDGDGGGGGSEGEEEEDDSDGGGRVSWWHRRKN